MQFLGADDAYIERIRLEDSNRVERERFELIDAIRDGRMRVVQTGTGAQVAWSLQRTFERTRTAMRLPLAMHTTSGACRL